jgi:uncharacterized protein YbjT (DUF2867 family)
MILTLTGPAALTFDEVADVLSSLTEVGVRHVRVSADAVRNALQGAGVPAWFARDMATLHGMLAAGYEDLVTDDIQRATHVAPRPLADFAADLGKRCCSSALL